MALILHIDTSGKTGIAMLAKDGQLIASRHSEGERDHASNINGLIADLLTEAGYRLNDVDAFAVCNGPGSYTGLRIGLATAKGFCYASDKPLILHSKLVLMLQEATRQVPAADAYLALMAARTGEYYMAMQSSSKTAEPAHIFGDTLKEIFLSGVSTIVIYSEDVKDIVELGGTDYITPIQHKLLDEVVWATETHKAYVAGDFADVAYAEPQYLKGVFINKKRADGI